LIQSGEACLGGHDIGRGPILPDRSCIIDCYPKDRRSGTYSDMTRTFVAGTPSSRLSELHAHCRAALDVALQAIAPGRNDAYERVVAYFRAQGFPARTEVGAPEPLKEGFFHSLGHGVGLEVHEKPWMGVRSDELVEGDVVAIEPGLYFPGVGGVRLEDTVLVTAGGVERFTDPYPYDLEP
jgi:Xaa-Pro aminopeptidase